MSAEAHSVDLRPFASNEKCRLTINGVTYIIEWDEVIRLGTQINGVLERYVAGQ